MSGSGGPHPEAGVDALHAELRRAGQNVPALRAVLLERAPDDVLLVALLRRAVPVPLLELVAALPPFSRRPRVLAAVVRNPRAPRALALSLIPSLFWRDLAEVATSAWLSMGVRGPAETRLVEMLPDLRLGDRVALARIAPRAVVRQLLGDTERRVAEACLANPRLLEEELLAAVRSPRATTVLLEEAGASSRWSSCYGLKLALVQQPRTPLAVALAQLTSLRARDLRPLAADDDARPLLQAAAARILKAGAAEP